ncbi:MAG: protease pro-enzyme activation domain-containing protein [Syntrophobacteraceae bacterium]|jgi:hypothetical protein
MIKKLIIAAIIFGIASLACLSIGIRSPFAVDNAVTEGNDRVVLHETVHPYARPEFDVGPTDPSLPMNRTILLLKIAPEKQAELDRLVAEQHDPSSPNFHHWLTPEEFGKRFGRSPEEIASVKGWLITHGFTIDETAKGGAWINFSGTAADVDRAFHANMHDYQVAGHVRHANSTDISIPSALAGLVAGPVSLHNFPRHSAAKPRPAYTEKDGTHDLAPGDFAVIYDVNNIYNLGYDGAGVTIAVTERTYQTGAITKWNYFRSHFGLPYNPPVVTVNGDPGDQGWNDDEEADIDVEWSGAVATGATINFVTSASTNSNDGVDLSAQYIVDNNSAPIISDSYIWCEHDMGSTLRSFYYNLWRQAVAQGITVFVASGDNGAYSCIDQNNNPVAPKAVNGFASTPFNTAVGGTALSDSSAYWNPVNSADGVSALGYMPEVAWNNYDQQDGWLYYASAGGPSAYWPKPAWQVAPGVPNDGARDLPDVSLNADCDVGYRIYTCTNDTGACNSDSLRVFCGTSLGTPSLAGIMALIVQSAGGQRQGNVNTVLYQLGNAQYSGASGASAVFHDITSGNNGFVGNGTNLPGYSCTQHYDLVTGLGSVNATNLFLAFQEEGSLTVTISPAAAVSAGAQWNVDGGTWKNSGATVGGLSVGSHTVNFNTITGWTSPASQAVNIVKGQTTSAGGLYVQQTQTGSLTVTISPAGAVSAGAKWNVDGGTWQNSGATVGNLSVGSHTLNFNTITGWTSPASQSVNIVNGQTTSAGGLYVQQTQTGSLTVTISPTAAVNAGAKWNVDGGTWQNSGATVGNLLVGSHAVNFNAITGWTNPASQTVNIVNGQTTSVGGLYVQQIQTGSLRVTIGPAAAVNAGAMWNVDNGAWNASGGTVSGLSAGLHTVNFESIPGWNTPASQTVVISSGLTKTASATYVLTPPTVESFLIDNGAGTTPSRTVTLNNAATGSPTGYMASQSSTFSGAVWKPYSTAPSFTLSAANGSKTVYFRVRNAGGVSAKAIASIVLAQLPEVTSFKIDAGAAATINPIVTLNNTATIPPTQFMASESPSFAGAVWQAYSPAPKFTLSAGAGTKTVYVEVQNSAGQSPVVSDTIQLIVKPTVTSFQIDAGAGTTSSRTVTLNNTATESPTYYMASQSSTFSGAVWKPYSSAPSFTLSAAQGNKTVYFKVRNAAGASYVMYAGITLD